MKGVLFTALLAASTPAPGQNDSDAVVVSALRDPVVKSYRRMVSGIELFEQRRHLAPEAELRFKLLPRKRHTRMTEVELEILGDTFATPVALAAGGTFVLPRDPLAWKENATVRPDRKAGTLTWRADIRSPGLPPHTRRLGDLRLECEVGMQSGLISNYRPFLFRFLDPLLREGPEYCRRQAPRYLFFADRPIFGVTLAFGERRETLPVDMLYGGASRDPDWKEDLPYCDCEVLMDRAYFVPLGDASWPDDTRVEFEFMGEDGSPGPGKAELRASLPAPIVVDFESGYEVWVLRPRPSLPLEQVLLFDPSGRLAKTRLR